MDENSYCSGIWMNKVFMQLHFSVLKYLRGYK
jgi:hypothetical protein